MQNQQFQVEVDPTEDTEWNDILREKGIIPERPPSPTQQLEEALEEAIRVQHENRLGNLNLDQLDELEDDEDEDFLESYKQQRLAEMRQLQSNERFGSVYPISKPEWSKEVTEASKKNFVFVHLSNQAVLPSRLVGSIWPHLASKFKDIKFCDIEGKRAIENYPDANCPTIIIYKDGDVVRQYVGLSLINGNDTKIKDFEKILVEINAVKENDQRLTSEFEDDDQREAYKNRFQKKTIRGGSKLSEDEDEDEDDDFFD